MAAEAAREAKIRELLTTKGRILTAWGTPEYQIEKKAPKLLSHPTYREVVRQVVSDSHVRPLRDWEPRGKGCETLFRSLCDHAYAKYPMPAFLWSAFFEDRWLHPIVKEIAAGGSLFTIAKDGRFPLPLTRAQVHALMTETPGDMTFTRGVRRLQVRSSGGSPRLFQTWADTRPGSTLDQNKDNEVFWGSVVDWFSKHPMFDPARVSPLIDYIGYRRNQDEAFSMKGRSPLAMLRGMEEWHGVLAKQKAVHGKSFEPSGFSNFEVDRKEGRDIVHWKIQEILSSKRLIEEGRDQKHCVASYSYRIEKNQVSIWSMSRSVGWDPTEEKAVTIEVINVNRSIVQARGKYNKMIETNAFQVMQLWAQKNKMTIGILNRW